MQEFVLLKHNANRNEWTTEWLIKNEQMQVEYNSNIKIILFPLQAWLQTRVGQGHPETS